MNFTPQQQAAITRDAQDVCVVAGPGSGKTRVLVERFRWLIEHKGVSPLKILAITFTDKAATEIKRRLVETFQDRPDIRERIERAYVSTVHGFCVRLLKENAVAAGVDPDFSVLDEPESGAALEDAAAEVLELAFQEKPGEFTALLDALPNLDLAPCLIGVYQAIRVSGSSLEASFGAGPGLPAPLAFGEFLADVERVFSGEHSGWSAEQRSYFNGLRAWSVRALALRGKPVSPEHFRVLGEFTCNLSKVKQGPIRDAVKRIRNQEIPAATSALLEEYFAPQRALLLELLGRIDRAYRQRKQARGALDFSDLEECTVAFLRENEEQRRRIRSEFEAILMDELQDTNRLQWQLLDLLRSPGRFFAVGDINQSIYGFRHADPEIFDAYRNRVASEAHEVDRLPHNFRSRAEILRAVDLVAAGVGIEPHALIAERQFPAGRTPAVEAIVVSGDVAEDAARIEAQWVARRAREIVKERSAGFRDMAVLVRTMNAWTPLRKAFDELGIPYLVSGGRTFYETREVRDLTMWLQALANPLDEISLAGVLRSPLVGIGDETLLRLRRMGGLAEALERLDQEDTAAFHPEDLERLGWFRDRMNRARAERDAISPDRLLARAIDECDYQSGLDDLGRANVEKFLARVRDWFTARHGTAAALLRGLARLRASESEPEAPPGDSANAVKVMTVHGAKGLEFPVVFLPALHRGINKSTPAICFSLKAGLGIEWRNPATGDAAKDRAHASIAEELNDREEKEEDRLLYVAMTRAEERLVLSFTKTQRPAANWSKKVVQGLAVSLNPVENKWRDLVTGDLTVRLLLADKPPENLYEVLPAPSQAAPRILARPALANQHDSDASVTSVSLFDECPRRYYLSRYLGCEEAARPTPADFDEFPEDQDRDGMDASEFGLQVHAILAGEMVENPLGEALELASQFQSSAMGLRAARASRVEREFDFLMAVEDVVLRGQIDLWFEEAAGELVLVDYKTDKVDATETSARAQSYALQLRLYALALERLTGRSPNQAFVHMLRPGVSSPISLEAAEMEAARESVRAFRQAQATVAFPLREADHCRRCPFLHGLCPAAFQSLP
jgi:ATP-dependent exoDNAse (exonuclease V) beta subunit